MSSNRPTFPKPGPDDRVEYQYIAKVVGREQTESGLRWYTTAKKSGLNVGKFKSNLKINPNPGD